jgi:C_GCAxxG_C_C family probable redox protein
MVTAAAHRIAKSKMDAGYNCCEAVLMACGECFNLDLPPEVFAAGQLFGGGIKSGCVCGALTGMVMAAGILHRKYPHPLGNELAPTLHKRFQEQFGSTCCRVICSRRTYFEKIGNRGCKELTGATAAILCEMWEYAGRESD